MKPVLPDISGDDSIKVLVDSFYSKVNTDDLLSPVFNDVARVEWEEHLPIMYQFWSTLLFHTNVYRGRPWPKHALLPVSAEHFARWVLLFKETVDENFSGPRANDAKDMATSIADTFQNRLLLKR